MNAINGGRKFTNVYCAYCNMIQGILFIYVKIFIIAHRFVSLTLIIDKGSFVTFSTLTYYMILSQNKVPFWV